MSDFKSNFVKSLANNPTNTQRDNQYNLKSNFNNTTSVSNSTTATSSTTNSNNSNDNYRNEDDFNLSGFNDDDNDEPKFNTITLKRKNEFNDSPNVTLKKQNNMNDSTTTTTTTNSNKNDSSFSFDIDADDYDSGRSGPVDIDLDMQRQELLDSEAAFTSMKSSLPPVEYVWQWKTDSNVFNDYDIETCKKIEAHRKKTASDYKFDAERFIDFGRMIQRRIDAPHKCREVRRVPYNQSNHSKTNTNKYSSASTSVSQSSKPTNNSSTFGFKSTSSTTTSSNSNNSSSTKTNSSSSPTLSASTTSSSAVTSSSSSLSSSTTSRPSAASTSAVWSWKSDNGWAIYDEETNRKIEESFVQGKKRFQVDDDRFIDFECLAQRRYDDTNKMRPVQREDRLAPNTNISTSSINNNKSGSTTPPPKPQSYNTPTKSSNSSSSSSNSNNNSASSSFFKKITPSVSTASSNKSSANSGKSRDLDSIHGKGRGKWKWSSDDGKMSDYSPEINELIESAYINAPPVNEVVIEIRGEKKIIDFISYVQRRFDDRDKRRPITRHVDTVVGPAPKSSTTTTVPTQLKKMNSTPSDFPNYDEEDVFVVQDSDYDDNDDIDLNDPEFLAKKRKLYACGKDYVELDKVQSWYDFIEEKRSKFKKQNSTHFPPNANLNRKISLYGGDITALEIDAIVNAARTSLLGGGGIDGAIHRAAGYGLLNECKTLDGCKVGQSKITKGYKLPAKYVIHTVGPTNESSDALKSCYTTTLDLIAKHKIRSVAMCCVATGVYGFDNEKAANIALRTVREWLEINSKLVDRIIFCVFTKQDYVIYGKCLQSYFPVHPE